MHSISLFNTFTVYRHSVDNVLFSISNALSVCYKESKVSLESSVTLCKLYAPAFCCSYLHLHLPPFLPPQPSFFPLSISHWESHLKEENRDGKNKSGDARTRGAENTKHLWVFNTKPCTDTRVHTHTEVYIGTHFSLKHAHVYTNTLCWVLSAPLVQVE